jgi:exonuclease III
VQFAVEIGGPAKKQREQHKHDVQQLHIATANVNTTALLGRTAILEKAFAEAEVDIIGLQETRNQHGGTANGDEYRMYASAATEKGLFGVSLWIKKELLDTTNVVAEAVSPRLLVIRLTVKRSQRKYIFIVAHAPHERDTVPNKNSFWRSLSDASLRHKKRAQDAEMIVLIDANARLGELQSDAVGPQEPDGENNNGQRCHEYTRTQNLCLANTFVKGAGGPTWFAKKKAEKVGLHRSQQGYAESRVYLLSRPRH